MIWLASCRRLGSSRECLVRKEEQEGKQGRKRSAKHNFSHCIVQPLLLLSPESESDEQSRIASLCRKSEGKLPVGSSRIEALELRQVSLFPSHFCIARFPS